MERRQILKLMAASALALGPLRKAMANGSRASGSPAPRRIVVIGAGIVGSAIGYELARRGAQVTILERKAPASGTTGDSFAYLNASTKIASRPYFHLNWLGLAGWRAWQQQPGAALPLQWGGALYWRDEAAAAEQLHATLKTLQGWGYASRGLDPDGVRRLAAPARADAALAGAFHEEEGALDPVQGVAALLARAAQHGAKLIHPAEVTEFSVAGNRIHAVRTGDGEIAADAVVLAAGLGSQALAQSLGLRLPLTPSTGILLHTAPQPRLLERVLFAPGSTIRQTLDGRIVSSSGHEGAGEGSDADAIGRRILAAAARHLPQLRDAAVERLSFGQRVIPQDGYPIAGFAPKFANLYVSVTHSGVTLAPILARAAAAEILDGVEVDVLQGFRPGRFDP